MIFKRRLTATLFVMCCVAFATSDNFQASTEDLQVVHSDPSVSVMKPPSRYMYAKEVQQCPPGENKMMLTLLLKSLRWSEVSEKKKEKAIKKLSRFFLIPRQFITVDDTHSPEIVEMLKHSINKSNNILNSKESVGRMEFMIGCGDNLYENGKTIAHQINEQVETGVLDELTGLPFNFWNIWTKRVKSRVQRTKRAAEGSGNENLEEDEYYDEDEDDIEENDNEEIPQENSKSTSKTPVQNKKKKNKITNQIQDEPSNINEELEGQDEQQEEVEEDVIKEEDNNNNNDNDDDELKENNNNKFEEEGEREVHESKIIKLKISPAPAVEVLTEENESITQRINPIDVPTPIDPIEKEKLETFVNKTIDDSNVLEIPLVDDEKDEYTEEVEKKIDSTEGITNDYESKLTTHQIQHQPDDYEVETSTFTTKLTTPITTLATIIEEIEYDSNSNTVMMTSPPNQETETVFLTPTIFENINNEVINNNLERLSIETETTTITPASSTSYTNKVFEESLMTTTSTHEEDIDGNDNDDIDDVDVITEETTTTSSSTTTSASTTEFVEILSTTEIPSTTQDPIHETSSFISIISTLSPTIENLTTEFLPTTSTHFNVDVTYAVSDKATTPNEETNRKTTDKGEIGTPDDSDVDSDYGNYDEEDNQVDAGNARNVPTNLSPSTTTADNNSDYDDNDVSSISSTLTTSTTRSTGTSKSDSNPDTNESGDYLEENVNSIPSVYKRIPKEAVVAGKPFSIKIDEDVFDDVEDGKDLKLQLLNKDGSSIDTSSSWIQFDASKRSIYGLPLESDTSKHEFIVRATDKGNEYADETIEITVQQFKGSRSANHEVFVSVSLQENFKSNVDWEILLIQEMVEVVGAKSTEDIIVREIRANKRDEKLFTFIFTNSSLPVNNCPQQELNEMLRLLSKEKLNVQLERKILIRSVNGEMIGNCKPEKPLVPHNPKYGAKENYPPRVVNQIDKIKASIGQLLVFRVPEDTFHDPEDNYALELSLVYEDRSSIPENHWLQFDSRNREFYGVPSIRDTANQTYILVAKDSHGLTVNDALVVEIGDDLRDEDLSVDFDFHVDMPAQTFKRAANQRKFVEKLAEILGDKDTSNIILKKVVDRIGGKTSVIIRNSTLKYDNFKACPNSLIEKLRSKLLHSDGNVRSDIKQQFEPDFPVHKILTRPIGKCAPDGSYKHPEESTLRPDINPPLINNDLLVTYILPTGIIVVMLIIFFLIACLLHKRKNTGKMELGDEEERKSFRSKGIPVIFQDELEEKPEITTKSPIILKDEKPPLLPKYNNGDHDNDDENVDQYIPPQPLLMGNRESRGKSPVTPSYRKPPPYVSP